MGFETAIHEPPRRIDLNADDWQILKRAGSLQGWRKVELIDGELFGMNAQYRRHA